MKKIKVSVGTNRISSTVTRNIEVEDNAAEAEIDEIAWETAMDMLDYF